MSNTPEGRPQVHTPESRRNILDDLRLVGPEKPIGYLPFSTIVELGELPEGIITDAQLKGFRYKVREVVYNPKHTDKFLYVYDPKTLQDLLDIRGKTLNDVDWPTEADLFVEHIHDNIAPPETDLFDLIADAYADYTNPGRKTYPRPLTKGQRTIIQLTKSATQVSTFIKQVEFNRRLKKERSRKQK